MSADKDDPNLTLPVVRGSSGATQQMQALIAEKGATRVQAAIAATHMRREEAKAAVDPVMLFWLGAIRRAVLGLPFFTGGLWGVFRTAMALEKHLKTEQPAWHDLVPFIPGAVACIIGIMFLAPKEFEAFARAAGFGGIVDKVIDRLPFLKGKEAVS